MDIPFKEIESGIPFLTVNKRLARTIQARYDLTMREKGIKVWESPCIMPFLSWLHQLWTEHSPKKFLLSPRRALILWESLLGEDECLIKGKLLSGSEVAGTAYEAYRLSKEYRLDMNSSYFRTTEESKALLRWSVRYEEKLEELSFIDSCQLPAELIKLLNHEGFHLPENIMLAGYDEVPPLLSDLISFFEEKGCRVSFWSPVKTKDRAARSAHLHNKISLSRCADESDEVARAARWIRKVYRQGRRIGILTPDLNRYRDKIIAAFNEELAPASIFPWKNEKEPFNISLGARLYDEPVARSAVDLLGMDDKPAKMDEMSSFLLSPYFISSHEERQSLACLDAKLKRDNRFSLSLGDIAEALKSEDYPAPVFEKKLKLLLKSFKETKALRLPGRWSEFFGTLLKSMGWPANSSILSSLEYQALQSFGEALSSLAGLDDITGPIGKPDALRLLTKITRETVFHGESEESPISVMGLLESAGMTFDEVWFMGAHDGLLPGQPSPNPFIPLKLQKEHRLPRSTYARELEFSKMHMERILSSADRITFSFPERVGDREANISPLLLPFFYPQSEMDSKESSRFIDRIKDPLVEIKIEVSRGLEVRKDESVKGGTGILKNQSDCPFRAFAIHRLGAYRPGDPEPGISPVERGSVIHKALETFWNIVRDDHTLKILMQEGKLDDIVVESAKKGLNLLKKKDSCGRNYQQIELERLASLLHEWVEVELERSSFRTLKSESDKTIQIGGLSLVSRIDRIDRINGKALALIDYKTGAVSTADWATERPKEPQLMIYASMGNYDAILFARIRRGECRFTGIAREEGLFPGIKAFAEDPLLRKSEDIGSWEDLMEQWKKTLEKLAADFINGEAKVDPRDFAGDSSACKYCDHLILCRIFEANPI